MEAMWQGGRMPMLSEEEAAALMQECGRASKKLFEMGANCVLILYTEPKSGRFTLTWGREGSGYEAAGMCRKYLMGDEQESLAQEIKDVLPSEPPDESEAWKGT